jgi:hypothetical protein
MSPLSLLVRGEGPKSLTPEGMAALHAGKMTMGLED